MARLLIKAEKIKLRPEDYPLNKLKPTFPRLEKYLNNTLGPLLQDDMNKTTQGWTTRPRMTKTVTKPYGTRLQLVVEPKGKGTTNWSRVNSGTRRRTIRAKTRRGMTFRPDYTPKTTPSGKYGGPGTYGGPVLRGVPSVTHEIEAREFTKKIMKNREKKIHRDVQMIVRLSRII